MFFKQIEDPYLAQYAYLIGCQATGEALLIDPERDIDRYVELALQNNLRIVAVAESHIHADFVSGVREFASNYSVRVYLSGEGGSDWQYQWQAEAPARLFHLKHGDVFHVGNVEIEAVHTPGHTPEHICFMITDKGSGADDPIGIITGDFVFVGDVGRPDLLESAAGMQGNKEPSARALYRSLLEFFQLPDYLHLWPGHGAGSVCGKALGAIPDSTVGYERRFNSSLRAAQSGEERFVREILHGQPEPPMYFAMMKRWNKQGPPLLPSEFSLATIQPEKLQALSRNSDTIIIDTRLDREQFFGGYIHGSLWAPLTKSFTGYAGSFVQPEQKIVVLCHDSQAELAVRLLWRIGLDNILGYCSTNDFDKWRKQAKPALETLSVTTYEKALSQGDAYLLLDVRGEAEYEDGHLPGAVCIPHTRLASRLSELPRGKKIAVHCSAGGRSTSAATFLKRMGFDAAAINEGIETAASFLVRETETV